MEATVQPQPPDLPQDAVPLGLDLRYPLTCLQSIIQGLSPVDQTDKWEIEYVDPWVKIWRPRKGWWYCYAVRLEQVQGQKQLRVAESWAGALIRAPQPSGLGPDLELHRNIVTKLLDGITDFRGTPFDHGLIHGERTRTGVHFSGEVRTLADVVEVSKQLRREVEEFQKR